MDVPQMDILPSKASSFREWVPHYMLWPVDHPLHDQDSQRNGRTTEGRHAVLTSWNHGFIRMNRLQKPLPTLRFISFVGLRTMPKNSWVGLAFVMWTSSTSSMPAGENAENTSEPFAYVTHLSGCALAASQSMSLRLNESLSKCQLFSRLRGLMSHM